MDKLEYSPIIRSDTDRDRLIRTDDKFKAIALDMDGVILDSPPTHLLAWQKALSTLDIIVSDIEIHLREGGKDAEIVSHFAQSKGLSLSREHIAQACILKQKLFDDLFTPKLIEGIRNLIDDLIATGYRLALVTGTVETTVSRILQKMSLDNKFEVVVTGDLLQRSKPDPEPYRLAIQKLQLSAVNCVAIENAPLGIKSAKAAGLTCVALTTSLPVEFLSEADQIFHSVSELRGWFFS